MLNAQNTANLQNFNVGYQNAVRQKRNVGWVCIENIFEISNFKTRRHRHRRMIKRRRRKTVATTETFFKLRREQGEEYGK
jgi:hypothetical protein